MMSESAARRLRVGMVGLGMIFEETYRPLLERLRAAGLYRRDFGLVEVELAAAASRTGSRAERLHREAAGRLGHFASYAGGDAVERLLAHGVDLVCIATPDHRHYPAARAALESGKHVLIEKPAVLRRAELQTLEQLALRHHVLAKVVYHKLFDPDHKRLRTLVADGILQHVNHGYCSLLEPKRISRNQFAEWVAGRNPGSYVAVHYVKLIDFTFFQGTAARLQEVSATGQRGLTGPVDGPTWDAVQLRMVYAYPDRRMAAFDIHTSWVAPDNLPGSVEQEVRFHFDNGLWNASQRRRGVEVVVEGRGAADFPITPNHHYNADVLEPWGERGRRGYGIEALNRFFEEVAYVEFGGPSAERGRRLHEMRGLAYNDLSAERNTVAVVEALETILAGRAEGKEVGTIRFSN